MADIGQDALDPSKTKPLSIVRSTIARNRFQPYDIYRMFSCLMSDGSMKWLSEPLMIALGRGPDVQEFYRAFPDVFDDVSKKEKRAERKNKRRRAVISKFEEMGERGSEEPEEGENEDHQPSKKRRKVNRVIISSDEEMEEEREKNEEKEEEKTKKREKKKGNEDGEKKAEKEEQKRKEREAREAQKEDERKRKAEMKKPAKSSKSRKSEPEPNHSNPDPNNMPGILIPVKIEKRRYSRTDSMENGVLPSGVSSSTSPPPSSALPRPPSSSRPLTSFSAFPSVRPSGVLPPMRPTGPNAPLLPARPISSIPRNATAAGVLKTTARVFTRDPKNPLEVSGPPTNNTRKRVGGNAELDIVGRLIEEQERKGREDEIARSTKSSSSIKEVCSTFERKSSANLDQVAPNPAPRGILKRVDSTRQSGESGSSDSSRPSSADGTLNCPLGRRPSVSFDPSPQTFPISPGKGSADPPAQKKVCDPRIARRVEQKRRSDEERRVVSMGRARLQAVAESTGPPPSRASIVARPPPAIRRPEPVPVPDPSTSRASLYAPTDPLEDSLTTNPSSYTPFSSSAPPSRPYPDLALPGPSQSSQPSPSSSSLGPLFVPSFRPVTPENLRPTSTDSPIVLDSDDDETGNMEYAPESPNAVSPVEEEGARRREREREREYPLDRMRERDGLPPELFDAFESSPVPTPRSLQEILISVQNLDYETAMHQILAMGVEGVERREFDQRRTLLHELCRMGCTRREHVMDHVVSVLATLSPSSVVSLDDRGLLPIHYVIKSHSRCLLHILLMKQSLVNLDSQLSPLVWAIREDDLKMAEMLLDFGASPHILVGMPPTQTYQQFTQGRVGKLEVSFGKQRKKLLNGEELLPVSPLFLFRPGMDGRCHTFAFSFTSEKDAEARRLARGRAYSAVLIVAAKSVDPQNYDTDRWFFDGNWTILDSLHLPTVNGNCTTVYHDTCAFSIKHLSVGSNRVELTSDGLASRYFVVCSQVVLMVG